VTVSDEFNLGLSTRKAIFKPYAQGIPGAYAIDKRDRSPCTNACPNSVNAQGYVALIAQGKYQEALEVILRDLPFPGVIGRICPHPCETDCRRGQVDEPVSICALKRFVADQVDIEKLPVPEIDKKDEKVAIIGSGPAGLTASYFLALEGYQVTVFDALPVAGGMLRVGIPDYRLSPEVLKKEIRAITRLGVEIKLNTALGRDITIDQLFSQGYKAVYLAIGAHKSINLEIPGEDANGVIHGVEFLRKVNLGELTRLEGRAIIVGGGNVAIDAARSALRLGAEKVTILYRRSRAQMPAREDELEDAVAEGIEIQFLTAPMEILTEGDQVTGTKCIKMEMGEPDNSGRQRPVPVSGSEFEVKTETVIPAIGQVPDSAIFEDAGIGLSNRGIIDVNEVTFATNVEGVFAGGDAQSGPGIAIRAVAAGKQAAISISRYLRGEDLSLGRETVETSHEDFQPIPESIELRPRAEMPKADIDESKKGFAEVELGLTEDQARAEAERCLNCAVCSNCLQCIDACKAGAIDHSMSQETIPLEVGSIIAAPGFEPFDPSGLGTYAYAREPNVLTSLEFERILSSGGPFQGHITRFSDGREPKRIAWLQCVGSRDVSEGAKGYCSSVCCMYALKQSMIAKAHLGPDLDTAIFYIDMRSFGKEFEGYCKAATEQGVRLIRSQVHSIEPVGDTGDLNLRYVTEEGEVKEETFDMVVLSTGLVTSQSTLELANKLGITLSHNNFAEAGCFEPVSTSRPGVYACGVFTGPKDIPQTVMEASAAASASTGALAEARGTLLKKKVFPQEKDVAEEPVKAGVFVCNCGINIGGVADVKAIIEYAGTLPNVEYAQENLFSCSQDAQNQMVDMIKEHDLNRVVVAACSPSTHEPIFREMLRNAGLNKYLFEMANIRNHCTWCHLQEPEKATEKCKDLVNMAVAKARLLQPLKYISVEVNKDALVIGGGVAGMTSALALARQGYEVHIVEERGRLGGQALKLNTSWRGESVRPFLDSLIEELENNDKITVHLESTIEEVSGFVGNFRSRLSKGQEINHGIVVLATGGEAYKPEGMYLYGENPNVLLSLDLDSEIAGDSQGIKDAETAAFIQCVGSRIPERPYCSKVCCTHSVENALKLKEINPDIDVYIIYRDMRTYGEREDLYRKAREKGVIFVRYDLDNMPEVEEAEGKIRITVKDHVLQRPVKIDADILTLASGIVPRNNEPLSKICKVSLNADGFFSEAHPKIRPVDCATDGIFLAGLCHYPKPIEESIAQALASASRASTILSKDRLEMESIISTPIDENCDGCVFCIEPCPQQAITLLEYMKDGEVKKTVEVNEALCKGCGSCMATCPKQGIVVSGFTTDQLTAQIEAALGII